MRYVSNESPDRDTIGPRVVGVKKTFANGCGKWLDHGHASSRSRKRIQSANQKSPNYGQTAKQDSLGNSRGKEGRGIKNNQTFHALRRITKGSKTNRSTPVVNDETHFVYAESVQQGAQVTDVSREIVRERIVRGLVGETTTEMIRSNATVFFP
jgi:hypothetical protein